MIEFTLNGHPSHFDDVGPDESVAELVRRRAGLTGTKLVCGSGACGACTVLVDGAPMAGCLLPAHHVHGRSVQTVENHAPDNLHPVQRAFMAHDGLQCGFCTPGFINSSIAFYQEWRAAHGTAQPDRETIADALAGNLCRCGAYDGIYAAVAAACAGDFDGDAGPPDSPRYEAVDKVTGRARYTVDIHYDGQLEGAILRSPHPHATVVTVDPAEALAQPGVHAYVDLLEGETTVRYTGQPIGAVAADDRHTAIAALRWIKVTYVVHPAAVGATAAAADDAPEVFSGWRKAPPNAGEGLTFPGRWHHNKRKTLMVMTAKAGRKARREVERATENVIERRFENAVQVHTAFEPHVCVARWDDPFHLSLHVSTQGVHVTAHEVAEHFDLTDEQVTLHAEHIGGGFGGKQGMTVETVAAVSLARAAGRPVRVALTRLEEMSYAAFRPGATIDARLAYASDGAPRALVADAWSDAGVAIGGGLGLFLGIYSPDVPRHLEEWDVVNHGPPGKPFRGPAGPQTLWAIEQLVDEAAHRLAVDPIALRRQWWPDDAQRHQLLDWAAALPVWSERARGQATGRFRRGVGISCSTWPFLYNGDSELLVGLSSDGFFVRVATQDIGTGTRTLLATAVADVFGVAPQEVAVDLGISTAPLGPTSGGSQVSNSVFGPAVGAAEALRTELVTLAAAQHQLTGAQAVPGGIRHAAGFLPWAAVAERAGPQVARDRRGSEPPFSPILEFINRDPHAASVGRAQSVAATVVQVEVDTRLGRIRPLGVWKAIAAGRIFVPPLARSQVYGGIIQGLGYALYEARQIDHATGFHLTANLEDYHIPGIGDVPPMAVTFFEAGFEHIRGGGIGIAELSTVGVAAAVGNAVFDATGWRPTRTPILPRDVIEAVR